VEPYQLSPIDSLCLRTPAQHKPPMGAGDRRLHILIVRHCQTLLYEATNVWQSNNNNNMRPQRAVMSTSLVLSLGAGTTKKHLISKYRGAELRNGTHATFSDPASKSAGNILSRSFKIWNRLKHGPLFPAFIIPSTEGERNINVVM
jgi:hypothetical protein